MRSVRRALLSIGLCFLILRADADEATAAALNLPYQQFDQTPHSGWRVLAEDEKRLQDAAALIEAYLAKHSGLDRFQRANLHWHAAQALALVGDISAALKHLPSAYLDPEPTDSPVRWNDYVTATAGFLQHDRVKLIASRERIASNKPDDANLRIVDSLIAHFDESYLKAYGATETMKALPPTFATPMSSIMHGPDSIVTQQFEIPTHDGRTRLKGQIDMPSRDGASRYPVVLMVNGGWFMERDGFMGNSGSERDLVYRDLAMDIVAAGIAVVRYDNRGVRCNEMTMPAFPKGSSELEISKHYLNACIDADVRQTVSVQTQMDDVEAVWNFTKSFARVESKHLMVWAHSEGGLNVARLISAKRIDPLGVIIVGSGTESPVDGVRRQMVDRYAEHLMRWDADGDGRVTQADVDRRYPADHLFPAVAIDTEILKPPPEGWTLETARNHFLSIYDKTKAAALAKPDDAPYPDQWGEFRMIAASNNWWKQWFEDTKPLIDHFAEYRGYASFHIGEIDSQSPGDSKQSSGQRQLAFGESRIKSGIFARPPRLVFHKGRGHSLRTGKPAAGPMDEEAKADLIREIKAILGAN